MSTILFLGTLFLFSRALGNDFVKFDDPDYVLYNYYVQSGLNYNSVIWAFTTTFMANWHPLAWLSHMLDCQLYGLTPAGHHATSILWHALNTVLVFLIFRRLSGAFWLSAFLAALFAWHPLRVESVVWVSERKDVLSGFFFLATLYLYTRYIESGSTSSPRRCFYFLALLAFALGLLAKPMIVTLPCVLLLLDIWPFQRITLSSPRSWLAPLREKIPFFALAGLTSAVTYFAQDKSGTVASIDLLTFDLRAANAVVSVARYLGKFFWPFDLAVYYPHPTQWPGTAVILSVALVLIATALALWQLRSRPGILIGWLWFLGMLVPAIGLVQVGLQSMADRYTYLPTLGFQVILLSLLAPLSKPCVSRLIPVGLLLLAGSAIRTWDQIGVWKNSDTLFEHALAVTENNGVAHTNVGIAMAEQGRMAEALQHFQQSVKFQPSNPGSHNNLGNGLLEFNRLDEAVAEYRIALRLDPAYPEAHNNLGEALVKLGRHNEARAHFEEALRLKPNYSTPRENLARLNAKKN